MKNILAIIMIFLLCFSATGCDRLSIFNKDSSTGVEGDSDEPKPFPVIINGVVIEESPAEIICLSPALTEIIFEFGEGERIKGKSEYCDFPLDAKELPVIQSGRNFEVETIIKRSPDLLLLSSPISEKDRIALLREEIATVVIPAPRSLQEFKDIYRVIGLILNGVFIGADEGETTFSEITLACNNPDAFDLGDFVYITENMLFATGDTLESSVLSCFGNNLAKKAKGYVFDKNELLEVQPDIVILNDIYDAEVLSEDEVLSQLEAVENGRIIFLNNAYFERPSARIISLIAEMQAQYYDVNKPIN